MGSSLYLQSEEYAEYGVAGTSEGQVEQASSLVDAYLRRPEGLVWAPDAQGLPAYMKALEPTFSITLESPLTPGQNVVVDLGAYATLLEVGDALLLDREQAAATEVCIANSISGTNVTLQQVLYPHAAGAKVESDMVIKEMRTLPSGRPLTNTSRRPLMRLISGTGRYGYGRRGDANRYNLQDFNLLASLQRFGGPPAWELFSVQAAGFDAATGNVWVPAGVMLSYYSEVKLRYVAGYSQAGLPSQVKLACASLINAMQDAPDMGDVRKYRAGDTEIERFSASQLSPDTKALLDPFRISAFI